MNDASAPNTTATEPRWLGPLWERLSRRNVGLLTALLGMLLCLPALWTGFAQDDYFFLMVFKGNPGLEVLDQGPLETFSFSKGDESKQAALTEHGFMPWWAVPGWKVNFWRPAASFSNWVDFKLFGESPIAMHLHSLLLYGVLILAAAALYRRFIGTNATAGLAALLFAVDSGHAIPVTWLSMRNALLTLLFGLVVLYAHDRWRCAQRDGARGLRSWMPFGPIAVLALGLALLSGESAVAVGGYLFAYALFLDPVSERRSLRAIVGSIAALLPYLLVVLLWRGGYTGLGYGTEGSGLYIDPVSNPGEFLVRLPAHMAVLLLGLFALPDAGVWGLAPAPWNHVFLVAASIAVLVGGWAVFPLLRANKCARFFLLGTVLSMVPACATMPMDRLMVFSSFGALGLVALFLAEVKNGADWAKNQPLYRNLALVLVFAHVIYAPINLVTGTQQIQMMNRILTDSNPSIPVDLAPTTRIVALNTPIDLLGASFPIYRAAREEAVPQHWWWLYAGVEAIDVERVDAKSLILRPVDGYLKPLWSDIFRFAPTHPMEAGATVDLDGLHIEVQRVTTDGRPLEVRFEFDRPLEDPIFYLVTWRNGTYLPYTAPAPGEHDRIPATTMGELIPVALGMERP